jgi:hypothetical protein
MIPSDLAARLRLITEASFFSEDLPLEPLKGIRPVPSQLPEYRAGDRFTAQIQKPLPDGTFEAVVDGKSIKLALSQNARPGDTLELIVARQTPRAVLAHPVDSGAAQTAAAAATGAARPALSPTGQLISFLLTGQPAPEAARLANGQPLAPTAAQVNAQTLAPALRQSIGESGLFYESQQSRWMAGKVTTESLLRQPQGELSSVATAPSPATPAGAARGTTGAEWLAMVAAGEAEPPNADNRSTQAANASAASGPASARAATMERLLPVMHQQLDALATHHYIWQGHVWPNQTMELEIEDPRDESGGDGEEHPWKTTLRLTLPQLGGVEAKLELDRSGIRIRLAADGAEAVRSLNTGREALASALEAANVPLRTMHVSLRDGEPEA